MSTDDITDVDSEVEQEQFDFTATYCMDDDKLRLSCSYRFDDELKSRIKAAGFRWAGKQEVWFAVWTPSREDLCLELAGEIEDEDYGPDERAADRAERFSGYRDKRRSEAGGYADRYDAGPDAYGNQNRGRAERQARRHERLRGNALSQWSKAEYWQRRTQGVINHALHKLTAEARRGRILTIEKEIRGYVNNYTPDPKVKPIMQKSYNYETGEESAEEVEHVFIRNGSRGGQWVPTAWLEPRRVAYARTIEHLKNRLIYENAMLENEGGKASEVEFEVGGWVGKHQILKVNRSPSTGRVVSLGLWGEHAWKRDKEGNPLKCIVAVNIERMGEEIGYRPPTDEDIAAMNARKASMKPTSKAPTLINPTLEDAQRLQDAWNRQYKERVDAYNSRSGGQYTIQAKYDPVKVTAMSQADYAYLSKGSYARANTVAVMENGLIDDSSVHRCQERSAPIAFKVRKTDASPSRGFSHSAYSVIHITDKPSKPLPLDWDALTANEEQSLTQGELFA